MTEMLTKSGGGEYNIHFRTDNPEAYKTVQEICRLYIDKERLTPKKVIQNAQFPALMYCPCCRVRFMRYGMKHCSECGQRIDWGEPK